MNQNQNIDNASDASNNMVNNVPVDDDTNIVVTFNQAIVASPDDIVAGDFLVKGKIVSR